MAKKKRPASAGGTRVAIFSPLLLVFAAGCSEDAITHYKVPREERAAPLAVREPQRLLGAVVSHADRTWFFKLLGPEPAVSKHEKEFTQFIEALRFKEAKEPIAWTAPEGWREMPGNKLRHRTFLLDPEGAPLEFIVTALGREAGSMLDNVNRWRGQMALDKIGPAELAKLTREVKVDGKPVTLVDMKSEAAGGEEKKPAVPGVPTYTLPKGWEVSARRVQFSIATFRVSEGDMQADVTISPLHGLAGGLGSNINRWRQQIGLRPVSEEDVEKDLRKIDVAGIAGKYADLTGPGPERRRILGVVVPREDATWFFKMTGPAELVEKQKANFEAFVKSVRFGEGSGGKP